MLSLQEVFHTDNYALLGMLTIEGSVGVGIYLRFRNSWGYIIGTPSTLRTEIFQFICVKSKSCRFMSDLKRIKLVYVSGYYGQSSHTTGNSHVLIII